MPPSHVGQNNGWLSEQTSNRKQTHHAKRDWRVAPCVAPHTTLIGEQPAGGEHLVVLLLAQERIILVTLVPFRPHASRSGACA